MLRGIRLAKRPTLHLIAGINGAGKTTFYNRFLRSRTPGAKVVNADEIERSRWPNEIGQHSYEAGKLAARIRDELLTERKSFVAETVFSHESKLEFVRRAQSQGFRVILYFIHVNTPELASARVATRVSQGGHDVPPEKVRTRYPRTLALLTQTAGLVDCAFVFDNSRLGKGLTHIMTIRNGEIEKLSAYVPGWAKKVFSQMLRAYLASRRGDVESGA